MAFIEDILTPDLLKWASLAFRLPDGTLLFMDGENLCVQPLGKHHVDYNIHLNVVPAVILNLHEPETGYDRCLKEAAKKATPLFGWDDGREVHLLYYEGEKKPPIKVFTVARSCVAYARRAITALYCMSFYRDGLPVPDFSKLSE